MAHRRVGDELRPTQPSGIAKDAFVVRVREHRTELAKVHTCILHSSQGSVSGGAEAPYIATRQHALDGVSLKTRKLFAAGPTGAG